MKSVFVFRTNVENGHDIKALSPFLDRLLEPGGAWNFDLEDCDNILRVESQNYIAHAVSDLLVVRGYSCEELSD